MVEDLNQILEGPNYFFCQKLACKLRLEICLKRQKKNIDGAFSNEIRFPHCLDCTQGETNQSMQKSGGFMADNLKGKDEKREKPDYWGSNSRLCDCGKKTLSPNCPYCPSCMSKKSRANKGGKEKKEDSLKENSMDIKSDFKTPLKAPKTPPQINSSNGILVDFSHYDYVLKGIERLAKEEVRPVELQIIYILKSFLKSDQAP